MDKIQSFNPVTGKMDVINLINPDKPKSIFDPKSEFMKELEIYKLKSEIKPRKTNMMQAQIGTIQEFCAEVERKRLYVPSRNGGFIKS